MSSVGFALCAATLLGSLAAIAVPDWDASTSYVWIALVACGALGLWPGVAGLVLGLVALISSRRHEEPCRMARWAVVFGAAAPLAMGVSFFALWLNAELT